MIKKCWLCIMIILPLLTRGQDNLVPNGSFEEYTACPNAISQIDLASPWYRPNQGSPDYFNACVSYWAISVPQNGLGYQEAHSGDAYVGGFAYGGHIQPNLREYIQVELIDSINKNTTYIISFYVNLPEDMGYAVSSMGAFISHTAISRNDGYRFDTIPQIINPPGQPLTSKTDWMLVTDTFISNTGGEKYITIGNFNDAGESDTLFVSTEGEEDGNRYKAYYFIDDVSVVALDTHVSINENQKTKFSMFPNPASNNLLIEYIGDVAVFELYDINGRSIKQLTIAEGKQIINTEDLISGIYNYVIRVDGNPKYRGKQVFIK